MLGQDLCLITPPCSNRGHCEVFEWAGSLLWGLRGRWGCAFFGLVYIPLSPHLLPGGPGGQMAWRACLRRPLTALQAEEDEDEDEGDEQGLEGSPGHQ